MRKITISASVEYIDNSAFNWCYGIESIVVDEKNEYYSSAGNCLIEKDTGILIFGCNNSIIPDFVTQIEEWAFSNCTGLTEIIIPDSVITIGNEAFSGCTGLTEITISGGVTGIGDWVFNECTGLTKITISDSLEYIGFSAFDGCGGLEFIEVDENNQYFYSSGNCLIERETNILIRGSKNSIIPDSVTIIGDSAFDNCTGLTEITITDSVTEIYNYAFSGCTGLTEIIIPDSVTKIGESAFYGCTGLTKITIPASVTEIGYYAFDGFEELDDIYYAGTEEDWTNNNMVEAFGDLKSVTMHYDVASVGKITPDKFPVKAKEIDGYIHIAENLTVGQTKEAFKDFVVDIIDINEKKLGDDGLIGTCTEIQIYDGETFVEIKVLDLMSDINGNTKIKTTDTRNSLIRAISLY